MTKEIEFTVLELENVKKELAELKEKNKKLRKCVEISAFVGWEHAIQTLKELGEIK